MRQTPCLVSDGTWLPVTNYWSPAPPLAAPAPGVTTNTSHTLAVQPWLLTPVSAVVFLVTLIIWLKAACCIPCDCDDVGCTPCDYHHIIISSDPVKSDCCSCRAACPAAVSRLSCSAQKSSNHSAVPVPVRLGSLGLLPRALAGWAGLVLGWWQSFVIKLSFDSWESGCVCCRLLSCTWARWWPGLVPGHPMPGHHPLTNECGSSLVSAGLVRMAGLLLGCCMEIWLVAAAGWAGLAGLCRAVAGRWSDRPPPPPPASTSQLYCFVLAGRASSSTAQPAALITSS